MPQSAIVTGASSGIGRASASRLAAAGYAVLAVARDKQALGETCREIDQAGGTARWLSADVTAADAPRAIVARVLADFGRLDAVVNAAGIVASGAVQATSDEGWDAMLDVNVRAPFRLIREATPALVAQGGAVVNVSSVAGPRAFPGVTAYCVSKAAVDQLYAVRRARPRTERRAREFRRSGRGPDQPSSPAAAWTRRNTWSSWSSSTTTHPLGRSRHRRRNRRARRVPALAGGGLAITGETVLIDGGRHFDVFSLIRAGDFASEERSLRCRYLVDDGFVGSKRNLLALFIFLSDQETEDKRQDVPWTRRPRTSTDGEESDGCEGTVSYFVPS